MEPQGGILLFHLHKKKGDQDFPFSPAPPFLCPSHRLECIRADRHCIAALKHPCSETEREKEGANTAKATIRGREETQVCSFLFLGTQDQHMGLRRGYIQPRSAEKAEDPSSHTPSPPFVQVSSYTSCWPGFLGHTDQLCWRWMAFP